MVLDKAKQLHKRKANLCVKMNSKKAVSQMIEMLITIGILSLALALFLGYFSKSSAGGFSIIKKEIGLLEDYDKDTVMNRLDKCPCDKAELGTQSNDGCPDGYKIRGDKIGKEDRACLDNKT